MGHELTGFLFPNDVHIHWSLVIVLYPYITCLVAGAFIVSSLYHVFGRGELKPVGRFALVTGLGRRTRGLSAGSRGHQPGRRPA